MGGTSSRPVKGRPRMSNILNLPDDTLREIWMKQDWRTEAIFRSVCKHLKRMTLDPTYISMRYDPAQAPAAGEPDFCPVMFPMNKADFLRGWDHVARKWCTLPSLDFLPAHVNLESVHCCRSTVDGLIYLSFLTPSPEGSPMGRCSTYVCNLLKQSYVAVPPPRIRRSTWLTNSVNANGVRGFTIYGASTNRDVFKVDSTNLAAGWVDVAQQPANMMTSGPDAFGSGSILVGQVIYDLRVLYPPHAEYPLFLVSYDIVTDTWVEKALDMFAFPPTEFCEIHMLDVGGRLWLVRFPGPQDTMLDIWRYEPDTNRMIHIDAAAIGPCYLLAHTFRSTICFVAAGTNIPILYNVDSGEWLFDFLDPATFPELCDWLPSSLQLTAAPL